MMNLPGIMESEEYSIDVDDHNGSMFFTIHAPANLGAVSSVQVRTGPQDAYEFGEHILATAVRNGATDQREFEPLESDARPAIIFDDIGLFIGVILFVTFIMAEIVKHA